MTKKAGKPMKMKASHGGAKMSYGGKKTTTPAGRKAMIDKAAKTVAKKSKKK